MLRLHTQLPHTLSKEKGSVLLEGLIAILIFSFGILAIVGLQANSMRIATDAKMRIDASNIANQRIGAMWADASNLAAHAVTNEAVATLPDGKLSIFVGIDPEKICPYNCPPTSASASCPPLGLVTTRVTWKIPGDANTQQLCSITQINGNP